MSKLFFRQKQPAKVIPIRAGISVPSPAATQPTIMLPKLTLSIGAGDLASLYNSCSVRPEHLNEVTLACNRIVSLFPTYLECEKACGLPAILLGLIHLKEADCDPRGCFENGDLIIGNGKLTHNVPKGKGPYAALAESAVACFKGVKVANTVQEILSFLEHYNGMGYRPHHVNSPYNWSMTTAYTSGHYIADGVYSSSAVDANPGCAAMLKVFVQQGIVTLV